MTIRECKEALRQQLSEWDPRERLRKRFGESSEKFFQELQGDLRQIIDLDAHFEDSLRRLFKKAASVWLDFGMHRCRVVVQLVSTPAKLSERAAQAQSGSKLQLTMTPSLGRYGNAKGVDLTKFTIIDDCKGDGLEIP